MVLELTEKIRLEGAQRACSPEETLERMRPYFYTAGITRLAEITGLDRIGICVAQCMRPDAIVLAVDSGKGATIEAAKCSAMMEGFERHVGETSLPPHTLASAAQLGDQAETRLPMIKSAVFHPYAIMSWTEVSGLRSGATRMVPTDAVRLIARPDPAPLTSLPFAYTSNGLSSGNTYAEAVAGGLYECIERDCTGIAQRRLQDFPRVDLDTITDPTVARLIRTLREADVTPVLIDVTSDIGVPAYICYLIDCDKGFGVNKGYAAHLDPAIAQARAITETIQARAVWIAGSRDDFFHHLHEKVKSTDSAAVLARLYKSATISANAHPDRSGETFESDIDTLLAMLEAAGIPEPLVYEFSHPYPCSVVRVIVPTLEGYTFDYAQPGPRALSK